MTKISINFEADHGMFEEFKSIDVHVHVHMPEVVDVIHELIVAVNRGTQATFSMEKKMAQIDDDVADLVAAVQQETTVDQSIITVVNGIPDIVQTAVNAALQAGAQPQTLTALRDAITAIKANAQQISNAVTANTPVPTPTPAPTSAP